VFSILVGSESSATVFPLLIFVLACIHPLYLAYLGVNLEWGACRTFAVSLPIIFEPYLIVVSNDSEGRLARIF
jgi:hypothetical protein